jgi:uncharacterized NAD(P)/FAD-binding protein YdhS
VKSCSHLVVQSLVTALAPRQKRQCFSLQARGLPRLATADLTDAPTVSGAVRKIRKVINLHPSIIIDIISFLGAGMNQRSDKPASFTIAIIGGGFSGAILASELLRGGNPAITVVLIEREGCPGRGVAYSTHFAEHLLNVRAQDMSALADDPPHFLRWLREHYSDQAQPNDYLPRRVYGKYVESTLCEAIEENPERFEWKRDEVFSITPAEGRATIFLESGCTIHADAVVLALGNFPPNDPIPAWRNGHSRRFIPNPWSVSALDEIAPESSVLLIGSGLTSVDIAISLRARGFLGKIHMVSRHGLLPQTHKPAGHWAARWDHPGTRQVRSLLRLIRAEVAKAQRQNSDWRAVIDSMRPFAQSIWRSLPQQERLRFLRHLRAYWDVHRHRVAPEIGRLLETEMAQGRLEVHGGRIGDCRENGDSVEVSYCNRSQGESKKLRVDYVINCSGPENDCRKMNSPLLSDLLQRDLVRPDPLILGLDAADDGALRDARGVPSDFLYTLGPLRKGTLWETTAVPEIRMQVSELASHLQSRFEQEWNENLRVKQAAVQAWD